MSPALEWHEIALRLALTVAAGSLIGRDRGERGHPAGLRTNLLVCLAASLAMIQANLLLGTSGKGPGSFASFDVMRLPLGILSGMGFIGAGAIVRRGSLIMGVTTAATLWFVTVIGLCFGGGQIALGSIALVLGIVVLYGLKWVEEHSKREQRAMLSLTLSANGESEQEILKSLADAGYRVTSCGVIYQVAKHRRKLSCEVRWSGNLKQNQPPAMLQEIAQRPGVLAIAWRP